MPKLVQCSIMPENESDLIGAAAVAKLLHVHRSTVTRMAKDGRLHLVFRGTGDTGEKFFNRSEVEALESLLTPERKSA